MTRRSPATAPLALLLAAACATGEGPRSDAPQLVEAAEAQVAAGSYDEALQTLAGVAEDLCPKPLRDRRDLARARAEFGRGQLWESYLLLERFSDDHPLSDLRPQVTELIWSVGSALIERDESLWILWSDRSAGRMVLEHLVMRHPDTPRLADALRLLGDMAFAAGDYELAQIRYREIILERPNSDWRFYANFRFAMSIVAGLRGPDYDLEGMQQAVTELRTFLRTAPENPQMVREAEAALAQVLSWQVQRHLDVVAYYRTLGNFPGQLHHARLATAPEFEQTPGYAAAVALRERLEAVPAAERTTRTPAGAPAPPRPADPAGPREATLSGRTP
ncbi:MAG: tetratricopeptide repeat protein [Planctomycetota bacterium]